MKDLRRFNIDPDSSSRLDDLSSYDTLGLLENYELRWSNYGSEIEQGILESRLDWEKYVGPTTLWGGENPSFTTYYHLALPLAFRDRIGLAAYMFEYAFRYDTVAVERSTEGPLKRKKSSDSINAVDEIEYQCRQSATGAKQMQAKMILQLMESDPECGRDVVNQWRIMHETTIGRGNRAPFKDFDEYCTFRIIDGGCWWAGSVIKYSIGVHLNEEELKIEKEILHHCWVALTLGNDLLSFDVEYRQALAHGEPEINNAVWLMMQLENIDVEAAKEAVRQKTYAAEQRFLRVREEFIKNCTDRYAGLLKYVEAYYYVVPANLLWSIDCPRYQDPTRPLPPVSSYMQAAREKLGLVDQYRRLDCSTVASTFDQIDIDSGLSEGSGNVSDTSESEILVSPTASSPPPTEGLPTEDERLVSQKLEHIDCGDSKAGLGDQILLEPYNYLTSMPSKGVREAFVDALDLWFQVPRDLLNEIKSIGTILHTASIMLDDMEDNSPLRRGQDAAHIVYGQAQTMNSANYLIVWAMNQVQKLGNPLCWGIFFEEIRNSLIGQSYEMRWRDNMECPTEEQYIDMVEKNHLSYMIGQYFQIRDDLMNLTDTTYTDQKGFCEDLDEGKFSYLIVHAWHNTTPADNRRLKEIFETRSKTNSMTRENKEEVLGILRNAGSFDYISRKMELLHQDIQREIDFVDKCTGKRNWSLRYIIYKLTESK
ncbi:hypothetical protein TWF281_004313 [Arthrobotrys megalospora]